MHLNNLKLTQKLVLAFITVLIIPSLCIGWFSYKTAYDKVEQSMFENVNGNVIMMDHMLDQIITNTKNDVDFLASRLSLDAVGPVQGDEDPFVRAMLDSFRAKHPDVELAAVGTDKGVYINAPKSAVNPAGYDPRKRPWYMMANDNNGKPTVINPYISTNSGQVVATVSQTVSDKHGVVSVSLSLKSLTDIASQAKIGKEGYIFIMDKNKNVLVHPTRKPGSQNDDPVIDEMFQQKNGMISYERDGEPKVAFFTTNEATGWLIAGTMPKAEIATATRSILLTTGGTILLFLFIGGFIIYQVITSIRKPLSEMVQAAEKISNGNLTVEIPLRSNDELGQLSASFNQMSASLRKFLQQMQETGEQLSSSGEQLSANATQSSEAANQVASSISDVAASMEDQQRSVHETTNVLEKMISHIENVAVDTGKAAEQAAFAAEKSTSGSQAIEKAIGQMAKIEETVNSSASVVSKLGDRSKEIGQIVDTIAGIAGQTNLLALNAAIEAARAGEQGRGFAVVADEVRKLAEQSQDAAKQIASLIDEIRVDTDKAVTAMETGTREVKTGADVINTTGQTFQEIASVVTTVSNKMKEISSAIDETAAGSQHVMETIGKIDTMSVKVADEATTVSAATEEQSASMEEIVSASDMLLKSAKALQDEVNKFKL